MIVLPNQDLVILTPPKTGSSSAHAALCNPAIGGIYVEGPLPGNPIDIECHTFMVPRRYRHFRLAVLTRHPYARAKSLNLDAQHYWNETRSLEAYVRDVLVGQSSIWWHWPVSTFVDLAQRFNGHDAVEVVRLESARDDLRRLDVALTDFPHQHALGNSTPEVTPTFANLVNLWACEDFNFGGYEHVGQRPGYSLPAPPLPNWCVHA